MDFPNEFFVEAKARVGAERLRAAKALDQIRRGLKPRPVRKNLVSNFTRSHSDYERDIYDYVVRVFVAFGREATAWAEMLAILHSNGVRTIIVEKLDRLARDLMVQEAAIADFHKNGFTLVSVAESDLMATYPTRVFDASVYGRGGAIRQVANRSEAAGRADADAGEAGPLRGPQALWLL